MPLAAHNPRTLEQAKATLHSFASYGICIVVRSPALAILLQATLDTIDIRIVRSTVESIWMRVLGFKLLTTLQLVKAVRSTPWRQPLSCPRTSRVLIGPLCRLQALLISPCFTLGFTCIVGFARYFFMEGCTAQRRLSSLGEAAPWHWVSRKSRPTEPDIERSGSSIKQVQRRRVSQAPRCPPHQARR